MQLIVIALFEEGRSARWAWLFEADHALLGLWQNGSLCRALL